jgi:hypothetical protein
VGEGCSQSIGIRLWSTDSGSEHLYESSGIGPVDFDIENFDGGPHCSGYSDDVLCGRDEARLRPLGGAEQAVDFAGAKRMVVGKRPSTDQLGAKGLQSQKEFLRTADPGKG